jgi:aryl-alcohol dehydrogenase-like predicted oxidoreductase
VEAEVHEVKEHRVEVLKRQWEETQANLGENLNIYHIHSATLDSGVLDNKEVLDHLWELKGKGTVMGLSLSGVGQGETLAKALSIRSGAIQLFGSVQLTYNILENSVNEMIRKAVDAGLGIIVKESLANGRLSDRNEEASFSDTKKVLADMAKAYDVGIDALAIAYIQQQSWPSVILSGAATAEQLESNMNACSIELDKSDLKVLFSLHENPSSYWKTRSALAWN